MSLKGGRPNVDGQIRLAANLDMEVDKLFAPVTTGELVAAALWYAGLEGKQR